MPGRLRGICWLLAGLLGCVTPVHGHPWLLLRSPHFEIWSELSADDSRELARNLEFFRAVVAGSTGAVLEPRLPNRIYVFRSHGSLTRFASAGWVAGFFDESMRGNVVCLAGALGREGTELLQHEYVHYVLHNGSVVYPPWYDEGFAEFLSTTRIHGERVEVGRAPSGDKYIFQWIPVNQVLTTRDVDRWSRERIYMFYLESWALVHYLHFGVEGEEPLPDRLSRYIRSTAAGAAPGEAFEAAFGSTLAELDRALRRYVHGGRFDGVAIPSEEFETSAEVEIEPAAPAVVAEALGRLSLAADRDEQARGYFEAALELDPRSARAQAGLGEVSSRSGHWDEAHAAFERAIEMDPDDALVRLDYARHIQRRFESAGSLDALAELVARARKQYVRSWKLDPSIPETYAMYGSTFLVEGQDVSRGLATLEHAEHLLPSNLEIKLLLARAYARLGRRDAAREQALTVIGWSDDEETKQSARDLLAELEAPPGPASDER